MSLQYVNTNNLVCPQDYLRIIHYQILLPFCLLKHCTDSLSPHSVLSINYPRLGFLQEIWKKDRGFKQKTIDIRQGLFLFYISFLSLSLHHVHPVLRESPGSHHYCRCSQLLSPILAIVSNGSPPSPSPSRAADDLSSCRLQNIRIASSQETSLQRKGWKIMMRHYSSCYKRLSNKGKVTIIIKATVCPSFRPLFNFYNQSFFCLEIG